LTAAYLAYSHNAVIDFETLRSCVRYANNSVSFAGGKTVFVFRSQNKVVIVFSRKTQPLCTV